MLANVKFGCERKPDYCRGGEGRIMSLHNLIRVLRAIVTGTVEVVVQVFRRGHADDGEDEVDSQDDELDDP